VQEPLLRQIIEGNNVFADVDCVLFTHHHKDHFGLRATLDYLSRNKPQAVIVPEDVALSVQKGTGYEFRIAGTLMVMDASYEYKTELRYNELRIKCFRLLHQGEQYSQVLNYSFLVEMEGIRFLHLGDGGFEAAYLQRMLEGEQVDCALLTFPFVTLPQGREIINRVIKPRQVIVLHLPSAEDDRFGYRQITAKTLAKYRDRLPETVLFLEPLQEVTVKAVKNSGL